MEEGAVWLGGELGRLLQTAWWRSVHEPTEAARRQGLVSEDFSGAVADAAYAVDVRMWDSGEGEGLRLGDDVDEHLHRLHILRQLSAALKHSGNQCTQALALAGLQANAWNADEAFNAMFGEGEVELCVAELEDDTPALCRGSSLRFSALTLRLKMRSCRFGYVS